MKILRILSFALSIGLFCLFGGNQAATAATLTIEAGPNQILQAPFGASVIRATVRADIRAANSPMRGERPVILWSVNDLPPSAIQSQNSNPATITLPVPSVGERKFVVRLRVSYAGIIKTDQLSVTVRAAGALAISANAGADFGVDRIAPGSTRVNLSGSWRSSNLPNGATVRVLWKQIDGPAPTTSILAPKAINTVVFLPATDGIYTFQLTASIEYQGRQIATASDSVSIRLKRPPAKSQISLFEKYYSDQFSRKFLMATNKSGFTITAVVKVNWLSGQPSLSNHTLTLNPYETVEIAENHIWHKLFSYEVTSAVYQN